MSPIGPKIAILALASSALAVPFGAGERHGHGHSHQHHHLHHTGHRGTGTGFPYGIANATGLFPTGTAASTGFPVSAGLPKPSPAIVNSDVVAVAAASAASQTSSTCTSSVVHKTVTNRKTVFVTAKVSSASRVAAVESSAKASSVSLTLSAAQKGYGAHNRHSHTKSSSLTVAAPSTSETTASSFSSAVVVPMSTSASSTSSTAVPTSTSSTSSTVVAPTFTSTSAYVAPTTGSKTSSAAATTSSASSSGSSGKRGVAYNDASLCDAFENAAEVTWGYNWGQSSSGLSTSFNYVPLLWGAASSFTNDWSASAQSAIDSGSTHLMSFNEPDLSSQSNLSPEAAAAAYKTYMEPFAGKAKLGAPAVTNGGGAMGLDWLDAFLTACSDCTIDFVAMHWYDSASNAGYFKDQVANATAVAGGKPVWVTEFGCTDGSDSDISDFLQEVMPWMDQQSYVERYSYFMVADGYLMSSGSELSSYGSTYMSYTSS